jgi:hypothetical protein
LDTRQYDFPASTSNGQSAAIGFKVPVDWVDEIDSRVLLHPYRSRGHLLRDALLSHFKELDARGAAPEHNRIPEIELSLSIIRREEQQVALLDSIKRSTYLVAGHIRNGREDLAKRYVGELWASALTMAPDSLWREVFRDAILSNYGELLDKGERVDLGKLLAV